MATPKPKTMAGAMRDWLAGYPKIDRKGNINYGFLGPEPTKFSIEDAPNTPVLKQYHGGALKLKTFYVSSRTYYGADVLENISNSGFYDDLAKWVREQNRARNFPDFAAVYPGIAVRKIESTLTGYIMEADASSARYQIPVQVTYFEQEGTQ